MPYISRKPPRSSFMTHMFGMGAAEATTIDFVGVPIVQFPPQPAPSSSSTPITTYALYAAGGLVAYWLLSKKR